MSDGVSLRFYAWGKFFADFDDEVVAAWLKIVGLEAETAFVNGVFGPHSGQVGYRKGGGRFIRSAPGEYPARDSGALVETLKRKQTRTTVVIGSDLFYSRFLTDGTKYMEKRKMFKEAMQAGVASAADNLGQFAAWKGVSAWKNR